MGEVGYVVPHRHRVPDLLAKIDDRDQNEGQGDFPFPEAGEGCQQDEREDHAAGPEEHGAREQQVMHDARDHGRYRNHRQQVLPAVLFLQRRPQQEDISQVAQQMGEIGVSQHMGEQPQPGQRVQEGCAVRGKQERGAGAAGQGAQQGRGSAGQGNAQHQRRVKGDPQWFLHACIPPVTSPVGSLSMRPFRKKSYLSSISLYSS